MPTEPFDSSDALYTAKDIGDFRVAHNLRRLKRYGVFYRRLRTRQRIGNLLYRLSAVAILEGGELLGLLVAGWGALQHRRKTPRNGA